MFLKSIVRATKAAALFCKINAPTIELIGGISLVTVGTYKLISNSDKIADVKAQSELDKQSVKDIDESEDGWNGLEESRTHYILKTKVNHAAGYTKACWKGVALIGGGVGLMVLSHATLKSRLVYVSSALATTSASFNKYRERVKADVGEEKDYEYLTGCSLKSVVTEKDGKVIETTIPIYKDTDIEYIPHSFFFDETNPNWSKNPEDNYMFLTQTLNYLNSRLGIELCLTENQIRDAFGAPRTIAGQASGAVYVNPDGTTNQISIGLEDESRVVKAFKDGKEPSFLVVLHYSDGKPINDNLYDEFKKLGWELY